MLIEAMARSKRHLASLLYRYQKECEMSSEELRKHLRATPEQIDRLAVCGIPNSTMDVWRIADYSGAPYGPLLNVVLETISPQVPS